VEALLRTLLGVLRRLLDPLGRAVIDPDYAATLCSLVPAWYRDDGENIFASLVLEIDGIWNAIADLESRLQNVDPKGPDALVVLIKETAGIVERFRALVSSLGSISEGDVAPLAAGVAQLAEILTGLWLEQDHPVIARMLDLLTLSEPALERPGIELWSQPRFERLPGLISDPVTALGNVYLPNAAPVSGLQRILIPRIAGLLRALGARCDLTAPGELRVLVYEPWLASSSGLAPAIGLQVGVSSASDGGAVWTLGPEVDAVSIAWDLSPWLLTFTLDGVSGGVSVGYDGLAGAGATVAASLGLNYQRHEDGEPAGAAASGEILRFERLGLTLSASASNSDWDVGALLALVGGRLVIDIGEGDSFIRNVLPTSELAASFALEAGISRRHGLTLSGGLGLDLTIPLDVDLTVVYLQSLQIHLGLNEAGADILVTAGLNASVDFAIAQLSVEGIGVRLKLKVGDGGNLGPVDLRLGFMPPTGIGVSVGTDAIGGGGFLDLDEARGQYSGMLALSLAGLCDITAIALIDTKLPDGSDGWSFLGLLFAEFNPGLQLGFGFTLLGVGGLFAFNKEIDSEALLALYNAGRIDSLMFPEDPIANAPQILADLRAVFPTAPGRVVFGPFVKMGFGTPTILEVELGLLICVPSPIVIALLGELSLYLPLKESPLVELHIDVLGLLDLGKKVFSLDGALRDSRILTYTLTGGMAFRMTWGQGTDFAFSIGGFHPDYSPPPDFSVPERLCCSMGLGDYARLEQRQYLALTPNTFQIGASIEFRAELDGFGIRAWAGFDALLYFKPFKFQAEFGAGVEVRAGGSVLASLDIDGHLSGPNPFRLWGKIRISLFFFDLKIPIDLSFGEARSEPASTRTPLLALKEELKNTGNWSTERGGAGVSLELVQTKDQPTLLDPSGRLRFLQRQLPLNKFIERFDQADLDNPVRLSVEVDGLGEGDVELLMEPLPPASWRKLTEPQRLSLPRPFEPAPTGLLLAASAANHGTPVVLELGWDQETVDESDDTTLTAMPILLMTASSVRASRHPAKAKRGDGHTHIGADWSAKETP
jgi:hypothetical protein